MRKFFAVLLTALALSAAGSTLFLCSYAEEVRPYVEDGPGGPSEVLDRFFDCVERQDWDGARRYLAGNASLGLETPPAEPLSARFWTAQAAARRCAAAEGYEMEGTRLLKRAEVSAPDYGAVPPRLHARVQELLAEAVENARLKEDVYDETGAYRPELVLAALETAAGELLDAGVEPYAASKALTVRMNYQDGGWRVLPDGDLSAALTGGAVRSQDAAGVPKAYEQYINNLTAAALEGLLVVPKVYELPEDTVIAPKPDPAGYGESLDPADMAAVVAGAAELLGGQPTLWTPQTPLVENQPLRWYYDETILALTWKQPIGNCAYTFSEVKVAHPSQFRRYFADDTFAAPRQYLPSEMAKTVNSVVALSGDFYKFRNLGIVVYRRQLYRNLGQYLDGCFVDGSGNLHMVRAGTMTEESAVRKYIEDNDILFSLAFGPVLVEHGELAVPDYYAIGEVRDEYARSVLCQLGDCHYLVLTASGEGRYRNVPTARAVAEALYGMGVPDAYMLDGGQTAAIMMGGNLLNAVVYGHERNISDILYFATAVPEKEGQENG